MKLKIHPEHVGAHAQSYPLLNTVYCAGPEGLLCKEGNRDNSSEVSEQVDSYVQEGQLASSWAMLMLDPCKMQPSVELLPRCMI
jgi:hypothetical protein